MEKSGFQKNFEFFFGPSHSRYVPLNIGGVQASHFDILRVVLGPYVQYCPCEASEQKLEQKPKSRPK